MYFLGGGRVDSATTAPLTAGSRRSSDARGDSASSRPYVYVSNTLHLSTLEYLHQRHLKTLNRNKPQEVEVEAGFVRNRSLGENRVPPVSTFPLHPL